MKLSKKNRKSIEQLSFISEVLKDCEPDWIRRDFINHGGPETWTDNETKTFDMLNEIEMKIKGAVLNLFDQS